MAAVQSEPPRPSVVADARLGATDEAAEDGHVAVADDGLDAFRATLTEVSGMRGWARPKRVVGNHDLAGVERLRAQAALVHGRGDDLAGETLAHPRDGIE